MKHYIFASWEALGGSWGGLGGGGPEAPYIWGSGAHSGGLLGSLGRSWASIDAIGSIFGWSWGYLGACWRGFLGALGKLCDTAVKQSETAVEH